jgi:tripartite ATP-independent transporter DctM subunit
LLIIAVLGSILSGIATATESASLGAIGAMILAWKQKAMTLDNLRSVVRATARVSSMVFTILIGAVFFTLVFRGYGGDILVFELLSSLPGGLFGAMLVTMIIMFFLGFFLDFIEIIYVVVPIIAPVLLLMGADPIWLAIMIAINLQTSFLTPPFGFSLFYLRGVAPRSVKTIHIYRGAIPFVMIQLLFLVILASFPQLATWLPEKIYGRHQSAQSMDSQEKALPDGTTLFRLPIVENAVDF